VLRTKPPMLGRLLFSHKNAYNGLIQRINNKCPWASFMINENFVFGLLLFSVFILFPIAFMAVYIKLNRRDWVPRLLKAYQQGTLTNNVDYPTEVILGGLEIPLLAEAQPKKPKKDYTIIKNIVFWAVFVVILGFLSTKDLHWSEVLYFATIPQSFLFYLLFTLTDPKNGFTLTAKAEKIRVHYGKIIEALNDNLSEYRNIGDDGLLFRLKNYNDIYFFVDVIKRAGEDVGDGFDLKIVAIEKNIFTQKKGSLRIVSSGFFRKKSKIKVKNLPQEMAEVVYQSSIDNLLINDADFANYLRNGVYLKKDIIVYQFILPYDIDQWVTTDVVKGVVTLITTLHTRLKSLLR
jgi:hypothetical protein